MEWSDDKQRQLEEYVATYQESLKDVSQFYKNIDWNSLGERFHNDIDLLKVKVDAVYDKTFYSLEDGQLNMANLIKLYNHKASPIYNEAVLVIESLNLQPFEKEPPHSPPAQLEVSKIRETMPKLTKKERRMSLDLIGAHPVDSFRAGYLRREPELTKPAATSTANVNVITRAEVTVKSSRQEVSDRPQLKGRFTEILKRFKFGLGMKVRERNTSLASLPVAKSTKSQRRISLVGDNLPLYIKEQLREAQEESAVIESPKPIHTTTFAQDSTETVPRSPNNSRIKNLLSNSESLYAHKAVSDIAEDSPSHTESTDLHDELSGLLKYYGVQIESTDNDHADLLKGLEDDDVDFVNVNESDQLTHDDEDDDEDYLFKI